MSHPFSGLFRKALYQSTDSDNQVIDTFERLRKKGYPTRELAAIVSDMQSGMVDTGYRTVLAEALAHVSQYID